MNTLLENIRASAILMKNLPSTLSGDALLISREEARRIGYELEACAERMEQKVPQGVEEAAIEKALRLAFNLGQTYWQQADSESYSQNRKSDETLQKFNSLIVETSGKLSGMAIVPVEETQSGYAGATIWVGDKSVTRIVSKAVMIREVDCFNALTSEAQECLDLLAATKEGV